MITITLKLNPLGNEDFKILISMFSIIQNSLKSLSTNSPLKPSALPDLIFIWSKLVVISLLTITGSKIEAIALSVPPNPSNIDTKISK